MSSRDTTVVISYIVLHGLSFIGSLLTYYFLTAFASADTRAQLQSPTRRSIVQIPSPSTPSSASSPRSPSDESRLYRCHRRLDSSAYRLLRLICLVVALSDTLAIVPPLAFEFRTSNIPTAFCWIQGTAMHYMTIVVYFCMMLISINLWFMVVKRRGDAEKSNWNWYMFIMFALPALLTGGTLGGSLLLDKSAETGMLPKQNGCELVMPGWYMLATTYSVVLISCFIGICFSGTSISTFLLPSCSPI